MKKLSILLIGLLLVSGMAIAQVDVPTAISAELDAEASVTFGIDLNDGTAGFYNDFTTDLTLEIAPEDDYTVDGDDGLYGSITVEDVSIDGFNLNVGAVTAMIVIDPIQVQIYSAPEFDFDAAPTLGTEGTTFENDTAANDLAATATNEADVAVDLPAGTPYGIVITIPVDPITVDIKFASNEDYTDDPNYGDDLATTVNGNAQYAIGADVTVDVDPLTVGLMLTYGWIDAPNIGLGATVDVDIADVLFGLEAGFGVDVLIVDGVDDPSIDGDFDLTLKLTEETDDDDPSTLGLAVYFAPVTADDSIDLDLELSVTEDGPAGFVPNLNAGLTLALHDLLGPDTNELNFAVLTSAGWDDGALDFDLGVNYFSDEVLDVSVTLGLLEALTGVDNTVFEIAYNVDDVLDSGNNEGSDNTLGIIEFTTTVSF